MKQSIAIAAIVLSVTPVTVSAQDLAGRQTPASLTPARQAEDLPPRFTPRLEPWEASSGNRRICPGGFVDPRDGTVLLFVRAFSAHVLVVSDTARTVVDESHGDYFIPQSNRYGLGLGEALRIDCRTGVAVGVVPRFPDRPRQQ
jgi:hypothetical protein